MSCLADVNIHNAMKAVSQALSLDDGSRRHDAYVHYLQCVQYIVQMLLKDAQIPGIVLDLLIICNIFYKNTCMTNSIQ